ncbi:hypothetical protein H2248_002278 [Termitomyces sp. 'cryptogamus']|nr:hypothetical protein H2248_002278 [Termitomyces sp. 'cryptogamus']
MILLVGPTETNAHKLLRLQFWYSAREHRFTGMHDKPRPGTLLWEVGYFPETTLDDVKNNREGVAGNQDQESND